MSQSEDLPVAGTVVLLRPAGEGFQVLLMRRPARGSFADAWVFPGGKVEDADRAAGEAEVEEARRAGIRETAEEVGLAVRELVPLSIWHPPAEAPTRIRTWFFLALAPDAEPVPSAAEVVQTAWMSPAEALARHATGEWTLFPPTWVTLHHLSAFQDAESAIAAAGQPRLFRTRVLRTAGGTVFGWDADRLDTTSLPWRYVAD